MRLDSARKGWIEDLDPFCLASVEVKGARGCFGKIPSHFGGLPQNPFLRLGVLHPLGVIELVALSCATQSGMHSLSFAAVPIPVLASKLQRRVHFHISA